MSRNGNRNCCIIRKGDEKSSCKLGDQAVCIGEANPLDSYLNIERIIGAAEITGSNAIHPGYGFLSESTTFAQKLKKMIFILLALTKQWK